MDELYSQLKTSIQVIESLGLILNFSKWYSYAGCSFFEGASLLSRDKSGKIIGCDVLGAVMIHHQINNLLSAKNNIPPIINMGFVGVAKLLNVSNDWVIGFAAGWDKNGARQYYNNQSYDIGLSLREEIILDRLNHSQKK